jgi:hypothetical protein
MKLKWFDFGFFATVEYYVYFKLPTICGKRTELNVKISKSAYVAQY